MTLHEAIEQLLKQTGRPMTTTEIANGLNKNKWYQKKDGSTIDPFQIHGRTKNYPNIFNRNDSTVSLNGQSNVKVGTPKEPTTKQKPKLTELSIDIALLEKVLMNEINFKSAATIDNLVPENPGLYCIRIKDIMKLPKPFDTIAKDRKHNILYIGIASQSLSKRFLNQELRANGHGTFFRSIGAVLGHKPEKGSLLSKANKRNYTFPTKDEQKIIEWINANLIINWVEFNGDFESVETGIIQRHLPLLNLAKNPFALKQLSDLRAECVKTANS
ncbi:hypothetical protein SAMN05421813_1437 [Daejeonella rubra]|uniref:HB1, ASXL, restriction endonuclease HTH domain n=1 Tax=Daejeonella rubra TaxID=990371 RepID=A0A1G9YSX4_9SPHI|nr:HTH domain-containing protein [Daejeonella rubra]SDN11506.1 hypothetical protein SAMN05421813_1437 [Daejeonella rubra]